MRLLLIVLWIFSNLTFAQQISWSDDEIQSGYLIDNIFNRLDESTQVIGKSARENVCEVHQYDTAFNLLKKKLIQFDKKKKYDYQEIFIMYAFLIKSILNA